MKFFGILLVLLCLSGLWAATPVSGIIDKDTEWDTEMSPILIVGDVRVLSSAVLRIEGGTIIQIAPRDIPSSIPQIDASDSQLVALKIEGGLYCDANPDARISFKPQDTDGASPVGWYGIVLDDINEDYSQIGHLDVSGAVYGIRMQKCKPEIHGSIFSYNGNGILCENNSFPLLRNNTFAHNLVSGISIRNANPRILCNIIAFNKNYGIWSDGMSSMEFSYNCVFRNIDGNLMDCPMDLGRLTKKNERGDSCDKWYNIYKDPVFAGSPSDSLSAEKDVSLPTDASRIKDTTLAKIGTENLSDGQAAQVRRKPSPKFTLSRYSPCVNAGKPGKRYNDFDKSPNDMGAYGGPMTKME